MIAGRLAVPARQTPSRLYDGYLFDLDGTVYLGDELLPGAFELITRLRELGRSTLFLSNNPTRDPTMYAQKLSRLGLPTPASHIVNTVMTMTAWLVQNAPDAGVFVIGEEPLRRSLESAGLRLTERPDEIDIVVSSYDRGFDYRKLQIAFDALWPRRGARLVTTNPDG
jgi:HAD superfamily hydrolase (TIGR01450 family)